MRAGFLFLLMFTLQMSSNVICAKGDSLKILTVNVWSGLDYRGIIRMGEYEPRERREARFQALVTQLRQLSPDVIFVQEANPLPRYAARLASALSMEEIHQVVNGGIKAGNVGFPVNLKEGLVILARADLSLEKEAAWKLWGSAGVHSDLLSFQFGEAIIALVGKIKLAEQPLYLVNVHLAAAPRIPDDAESFRKTLPADVEMDEAEFNSALKVWQRRDRRRKVEVEDLLRRIEKLPPGVPVIVGGDFNAAPQSPEMVLFAGKSPLVDVLATGDVSRTPASFTWDTTLNGNTAFTVKIRDARGRVREGFDLLAALASNYRCRLDYIFLSEELAQAGILDRRIVLKESVLGVQASDHFAVMVEIKVNGLQAGGSSD